jgi:hypothetical protein
MKQPNTQLTMTTTTLQELLKDEGIRVQANTLIQIDAILEAMEMKADFFFKDAKDLANKNYERGFFDGVHNAKAKIKDALEKK